MFQHDSTKVGALIGCRALGCVWIWRKLGHSRDLASSRLSLARHILANPPISTVACVAPPDWGHRLHFNLNYLLELGLVEIPEIPIWRSFSIIFDHFLLCHE